MKAVKKVIKASTDPVMDLLKPDMPNMKEPQTMPDPDDEEMAKAEQRKMQRRRRTGRLSTVLSGESSLG